MTWKDTIDKYMEEQNIKIRKSALSEFQEREVQTFIEEIINPAFAKIKLALEKYKNIEVDIMTSKDRLDSINENIVLYLRRSNLDKLAYRPSFSIGDEGILLTVQYSFPHLYERARQSFKYSNSTLVKYIYSISEEIIIEDFTKVVTQNINFKK